MSFHKISTRWSIEHKGGAQCTVTWLTCLLLNMCCDIEVYQISQPNPEYKLKVHKNIFLFELLEQKKTKI